VVAVLGAMDEEIREFLTHTERREEREWNGFTFHTGRIENADVVIAKSGVGKVLSAMLTQRLIDLYRPDAVIFTGLAGGLTDSTEIGDTVISRDCVQHDFDATAFGFERGRIPFTPYRIVTADERLVRIASNHVPDSGKIVVGRILTGDQFITHAALSSHQYLVDELEGDAVEMEGASVALVSAVNEVPFVIIRTISDKADRNARVDFQKFLPVASRNSYGFVRFILSRL
jgi:5'-methylthioadenosine/S-adenosylhomocysteine nucleosidase